MEDTWQWQETDMESMCNDKKDYRLLSIDLNKIEMKTEGGDEDCVILLNNGTVGLYLPPYINSAIRQKEIPCIFQ